jgi:hypothetical protein
VLILAYELLMMASKSTAPKKRSFLARAFAEYFVEPEICCQIAKALEAERKRLAEGLAGMKVLRVIQDMGGLLPSIELCTVAWDMEGAQRRPYKKEHDGVSSSSKHISTRRSTVSQSSQWSRETTAKAKSRQSPKTVSFASPPLLVLNPEDVHIKVFLKPGRTWPFDSVTSIELHENSASLMTSGGLIIKLERGGIRSQQLPRITIRFPSQGPRPSQIDIQRALSFLRAVNISLMM